MSFLALRSHVLLIERIRRHSALSSVYFTGQAEFRHLVDFQEFIHFLRYDYYAFAYCPKLQLFPRLRFRILHVIFLSTEQTGTSDQYSRNFLEFLICFCLQSHSLGPF